MWSSRKILMRTLCRTLPLLLAPMLAWAQLGPAPGLSPSSLNQPNGPAQLDASGTLSSNSAIATGGSTPRALADRAAERLDVKDYGATGNTQTTTAQISIAAGSSALATAAPVFAPGDVGKTIIIPGAGAVSSLGTPATIAVLTAGSNYSSAPTITLGNTGNGKVAKATANMIVQSVTLASGGAGCNSGTQTFQLGLVSSATANDGSVAAPYATITGTVTGGVLAGTLTITTAGSYTALPATLAAVTLTGGNCATAPTVSATFGLGSVYVAMGSGYPAGVTATISGGSPSVAATIGTPVMSFATQALTTTIASYVNAKSVTLTAPASSTLNLATQPYPGSFTVQWGTDDTASFAAAISAANARMAMSQTPCVYMPTGMYMISAPPGAFSQGAPGCITGETAQKSVIALTPSFAGDLFAWSEAWIAVTPGGPRATNFRVSGLRNLAFPVQQNALMFYDRNDNVDVENVDIFNLPGQAFRTGISKNTAFGFMRESRLKSLRFFSDGAPGLPVMEFNNVNGGGDATNEVSSDMVDIYGSYGPSLVIRGVAPVQGGIAFSYLRIEGIEGGNVAGDLMQIGDPGYNGIVAQVIVKNMVLLDPYPNYAALRVTAPSATYAPYLIDVDGTIGGGLPNGQGLVITQGRNSRFRLISDGSIGSNVTMGPNLGGGIELYSIAGAESAFTYNVDPTSVVAVSRPLLLRGLPSSQAVDLQTYINATSQIASGLRSFACCSTNTVTGQNGVALGDGNTVSALFASALGNNNSVTANIGFAAGQGNHVSGYAGIGYNNTVAGAGAMAFGTTNTADGVLSMALGTSVLARGRWGYLGVGHGTFVAPGDGQMGWQQIRAITSGNTPIRLTSDKNSANTANTINLPNKGAYGFGRIEVVAYDPTNLNACMWYVDNLLVKRGASAATMALVGTPTITMPQCDTALGLTAAALTVGTDTLAGGVAFTVTGPSGITLHVLGVPMSVEVQ